MLAKERQEYILSTLTKRRGNVSAVSGLLNACTYIGSAVSTYGIALTSDALGWHLNRRKELRRFKIFTKTD